MWLPFGVCSYHWRIWGGLDDRGNIPGETQVVSTQIYTYVESLDHNSANALSVLMLLFLLSYCFLSTSFNTEVAGVDAFRVQK